MTTQMQIPTMIVDDQADVRLLLRLLIDRANEGLIVVAEAATGQEAIDQAERIDPMVIVLDQMMPEMNGVETATRLRATRPTQVIVLCTAYLDDEVIELARRAGVDHCVSKETVQHLPDLIRRAVRG
jgi:CheY-like chemotaxis protein